MSQVEKYEVPGSPLTMAILKTALENMFAAIGDCNRGASAPSNPSEGMLWWDTSGTPTELLKRFTAVAGWVTLFSVNVTSGIVTPYRAGSPLGTMAAEAATDYIAKSLFNAQTILAAVDDNAPGPVSVAQNRIVGRRTGNIAALTLTDVLDMIGSAAEGDILYRGADGWVRLGKGSAGQGLKMNSTATAPEWGTTGKMNVLAKTGNYTLAAGDSGKLITCNGTFTLSAEAAAMLGDGWWVAFKNIGTGTITFNPDGSEVFYYEFNTTFTSAALPSSCFIVCNGVGFYLMATGMVLDGTITFAKLPQIVASGTLLVSNNTEVTKASYGSYTLVKEMRITRNCASLRITFDLKTGDGINTAYGRIYKNGVALGTERSTKSTSYTTYTQDFTSLVPGDLIQLCVKTQYADRSAVVRNLQLYGEDAFNVWVPMAINTVTTA